MNIVGIDGMDREERCKNYLEGLIGNDHEGEVHIWGHKYLVHIGSADIFHQIAQSLEITKISGKMGFVYYIRVPREESEDYETYTIALDDFKADEFTSKYGDKYQINN